MICPGSNGGAHRRLICDQDLLVPVDVAPGWVVLRTGHGVNVGLLLPCKVPLVRDDDPLKTGVTVATFALIHGGGDAGWYWHLVERELRRRGHDTVAPDLPCEDDAAGLPDYANVVIDAIGDRRDVAVVAQSSGGFTAPLVAAAGVPVFVLVLVAGMIPAPGEAPEDWPANTGFDTVMAEQAQRFRGEDLIYHDVPAALAAQARSRARAQSDTPGHAPWPLAAWPPVVTKFVLCTEDRFFPPAFMRRVVADRLGIIPDEIAAGHAVALSRPKELAELLASYANPNR